MIKQIAALLAVFMMLSGCSGADSSEIDALHAQIDALNTKIDALSMQIETLETRIGTVQNQAPATVAAEPEETLDALSQAIVDALQEYRTTPEYARISATPNYIEVQEAFRMQVRNINGFDADYLLVSVGCNNDIYGGEAGKLVIDLTDNAWCDCSYVDMNNPPVEPASKEEVMQVYLWAYSSDGDPNDGAIWTDSEIYTYLTDDEIDRINAALMG